jgi:hypothetical protein
VNQKDNHQPDEKRPPPNENEGPSNNDDLLSGKIEGGAEDGTESPQKQAAPVPRFAYTVKALRLTTSTARSVLKMQGRYYQEPEQRPLYRTLKTAQRAALKAARKEADESEGDNIRVLYVTGGIDDEGSVFLYEVEEIEFQQEDEEDEEGEGDD